MGLEASKHYILEIYASLMTIVSAEHGTLPPRSPFTNVETKLLVGLSVLPPFH